MGSTGSSSFSDYTGAKSKETPSPGAGGGASGTDKCQLAFSSNLEEVAQCDFYAQSKSVPAPGSELSIVVGKRVFAVDSNGTKVGALPTAFNYLAACIADGVRYVGVVKSSAVAPLPTIEADFAPH